MTVYNDTHYAKELLEEIESDRLMDVECDKCSRPIKDHSYEQILHCLGEKEK